MHFQIFGGKNSLFSKLLKADTELELTV